MTVSGKRLLLIALMLSGASKTVGAVTLNDALATAYNTSPDLGAQRAVLRQLDEDVSTAVAGTRPTITGGATFERSKNRSTFIFPEGSRTSQFGSTDQNFNARLTQPVFRGNRITNNIRAADATVDAGRETLRNAEISLLVNTATAYMDVVRDTAVLSLNDNQVAVLQRQLQAAKDRFEVGELTRTDVAQSEARLALAVSNRTAAEGALTASREAYRQVVGQAPETLVPPSELPPQPNSVDQAVERGLDKSPTITAAVANEKAARYRVSQAKGAVLPSLDGIASLSHSRGDTLVGDAQTGGRRGTNLQAGVQITIPFYQSGAEYSAVRRAQEVRSQRMLEVASAERQVTEDVRNAWEAVRTARETIRSASSAVEANEIALEGVRQEQQVGSRTILDVLDAEQELLDSRVTLTRAQRDEVVAVYRLLAATGELSVASLGLTVDGYDPAQHYNKVKYRWFGWNSQKQP
ncbi:MAG: hypothetical protein E6R12_08735 [Sphingomonadales bacterium]|nr:MAG: hypothetical protein E6R12_08735 [Sphingomonadales bacterium]